MFQLNYSRERYRQQRDLTLVIVSRSKASVICFRLTRTAGFPATGHRLPKYFRISAILFVKAKVNTVVFTSLMNLDFAKSLGLLRLLVIRHNGEKPPDFPKVAPRSLIT